MNNFEDTPELEDGFNIPDDQELEEELEKEQALEEKTLNPDASRGVHYVDKELLYQAYVDWYAQCDIAKAEGKERPDPPRYISESILKICYKLAGRYNFANYQFREEMVGDAIENIFRYIDRFDINKSKNPFGYFSITAYWAMVRRIKNEKLKAAVKHAMIINSGVLDTMQTQEHDDAEDYRNMLESYQIASNDSLAHLLYSPNKKRKVMEKKKKGYDIDNFLEEALNEKDDINE